MEEIPQKAILLEWKTFAQIDIGVVPAPTTVFPDQYLITPHSPSCPQGPGCIGPGCPASGHHHH
jgi:hypothetical protein